MFSEFVFVPKGLGSFCAWCFRLCLRNDDIPRVRLAKLAESFQHEELQVTVAEMTLQGLQTCELSLGIKHRLPRMRNLCDGSADLRISEKLKQCHEKPFLKASHGSCYIGLREQTTRKTLLY